MERLLSVRTSAAAPAERATDDGVYPAVYPAVCLSSHRRWGLHQEEDEGAQATDKEVTSTPGRPGSASSGSATIASRTPPATLEEEQEYQRLRRQHLLADLQMF